MNRLLKTLVALTLIFLCVFSVWVGRACFFPKAQLTKEALDWVRSKGDSNAPIWIVEYMDYQCPSCQNAAFLIRDIFTTYPSKVYIQARFFPLVHHKYGLKAAIYAYAAAGLEKFWPFHEILFEKQAEWGEVPEGEIDALFENYAKSVGIDAKRLKASVEDPSTKQKVLEEIEKAKSLGVSITPSFFINGRLVAGFSSFQEEMSKSLNVKLERGV